MIDCYIFKDKIYFDEKGNEYPFKLYRENKCNSGKRIVRPRKDNIGGPSVDIKRLDFWNYDELQEKHPELFI